MAIKILSGIDVIGDMNITAADVPALDASKISTGAFDAARIPNLPASKITSGAFDIARIPDLSSLYASSTITLADLGYTGDTNANYITNNNQLTNGAGYITSYTETDTLASVVSRGNSTSTTISVGGIASGGIISGSSLRSGSGSGIYSNIYVAGYNTYIDNTATIWNLPNFQATRTYIINKANVFNNITTYYPYFQNGELYTAALRDMNNSSYYVIPSNAFISAAFNGSVGVGTTSPTQKLEVNGNIRLGSNNAALIFNTSASSGDPMLKVESNGGFSFKNTAGSTSVFIDNGGNVGIGTTSPSRKLHVNSSGTNQVAIFESTDSTAYITLTDNTSSSNLVNTNGVFSVEVDQGNQVADSYFRVVIDTTEKMRINSAGNVGIGTTSPQAKLHVTGDGIFGDVRIGAIAGQGVGLEDAFNSIIAYDAVSETTRLAGGAVTINPVAYQFDFGAQSVYFGTFNAGFIPVTNALGAGNSPLYVDQNTGNIGIGTTSPDQTLEVRNGVIGAGQGGGNLAPIGSNDAIIGLGVGFNGESGAFWSAADTQIFLGGVGANSTEGISGMQGELITNSGASMDLRIGNGMLTANPMTMQFTFAGSNVHWGNISNNFIAKAATMGMADTGLSEGGNGHRPEAGFGEGLYYRNPNAAFAPMGYADFQTSDMWGGLVVNGNIMSQDHNSTDGALFSSPAGFGDIARYSGSGGFEYTYGSGSVMVSPMTAIFEVFGWAGSDKMQFDPMGANTLFAPSFTPTSDRRLKENIVPVSNGLDIVCGLQGVEYDLKINGKASSGFIAQDVEEIVPHAVVEKDEILRLNYNSLAAYHNEAIKELKGMIDALKSEVHELKSEIQQLKKQ